MNIDQIYEQLPQKYEDLILKIQIYTSRLSNKRAKEYFENGVGRRVSIIYRSIVNIFSIFPVDRVERLTNEELWDVDINLHAIQINIQGIIENIGLGLAYEKGLLDPTIPEKKQKRGIGLFNRDFLLKMDERVRIYFSSKITRSWYHDYSSEFRDALAHRIPSYVPPGIKPENIVEYNSIVKRINEIYRTGWTPEISTLLERIEAITIANPLFTHSLSEKSKHVSLHPQIITDFITIEEMLYIVIDESYIPYLERRS